MQIEFPQEMQKEVFVLEFATIKADLEQKSDFAEQLLQAFLYSNSAFYEKYTEQISMHYAFLCYFIGYFSFLPFFIHTREQINKVYDEEIWRHGHCPYCGSGALYSYLKDKVGNRVNACSLCLGIYRVPRIQCPYCLEEEQKKLSYFTSDTDSKIEVCLCKTCKKYIKIEDQKEREEFTPNPLLDDFKSITMDILATEKEYSKGVLSLWL